MQLEFNNGVAINETQRNNVMIKIVATLGTIITVNTSNFDSSHHENNIDFNPSVDYSVVTSEKQGAKTYESLLFYQENNVKTLKFFNESMTSVETFKDLITTGEILSNQYANSRNILEAYSTFSDIINTNIVKEENSMTSKFVNHRDNVEKLGIFIGMSLGLVSQIPPLFSLIDWRATIPSSILFFTLPAFILLRRRLREENK